jgi:hypothetical protein
MMMLGADRKGFIEEPEDALLRYIASVRYQSKQATLATAA